MSVKLGFKQINYTLSHNYEPPVMSLGLGWLSIVGLGPSFWKFSILFWDPGVLVYWSPLVRGIFFAPGWR